MKKVLSFVLVIAILCTISVPCFAANPSVSIKTSNTAAVGETITVSVNLSANSGLGTLSFAASFDTSEFQLVQGSAKFGNVFTELRTVKENTNGIEFYGAETNVVNGSGAVATFQLKVLKTGGKISLTVKEATDNNYQNVSVAAVGTTVNCSHADTKWVVTKNATCTEKGVETGTCTCGYVETRDIAMLDHNFGEWKIISQATATQKGLKEKTCQSCSAKEILETPMLSSVESTTKVEIEITSSPIDEPVTELTTKSSGDSVKETTTKKYIKPSVNVTKPVNGNVSNSEPESETESVTELESQLELPTETTTVQQIQNEQNNQKGNATPVVVGIISFALGIPVGIGAALFIIKCKSKEE